MLYACIFIFLPGESTFNSEYYRPIAKLSDRAFAKHENEAYCVKTKNSLYFYIAKSEF